MDLAQVNLKLKCHVVALPWPGRGHINPMMNLCKLIAMRQPNILITVIVTEEWHGFLCSESIPGNIKYGQIPNVIPSEMGRGKDFPGFLEAVLTKMEGPVERLLDQLEQKLPTPSVIIHDTYLSCAVGIANRRNIPAASFWPMSATALSILHHHEILVQNGHFPAKQSDIEVQGEKSVNYVRGVPPLQVADLPRDIFGPGVLKRFMEAISLVPKGQYVLLSSVYELESQVINSLKGELPIPIYSVGPSIPYFKLNERYSRRNGHADTDYIAWLDAQPEDSVLYISQGSFLSASSDQLDEVIAGVYDSGVRFFWVAREDISTFQRDSGSKKGLVVSWCDQLKVLCHPSIGGFWSHCGWNSTKEGAYAGIPMLTSPIAWDQFTNSKQIVEDWKIGFRVKGAGQRTVTREEISRLLKRFMDLESDERKEMKRRSQELRKSCRRATAEGGSSELEIEAFIKKVSN